MFLICAGDNEVKGCYLMFMRLNNGFKARFKDLRGLTRGLVAFKGCF